MLQGVLDRISQIITAYGSWGVLAISFLEEIVAPIPSTLTIMGAGFILLTPYESFATVFFPALIFVAIPAALGMSLGGLVIYGLVYFGEKIIIDRWGKWLGLSWESIRKVEKYFQAGRADELVLVALRAIPMFPNSLISGVCAFIHYPIRTFFVLSFLGGIPRALFMALLGWWAETAYIEYAGTFSNIENYILGFCGMLGLAIIVAFLIKKKRSNFKDDYS